MFNIGVDFLLLCFSFINPYIQFYISMCGVTPTINKYIFRTSQLLLCNRQRYFKQHSMDFFLATSFFWTKNKWGVWAHLIKSLGVSSEPNPISYHWMLGSCHSASTGFVSGLRKFLWLGESRPNWIFGLLPICPAAKPDTSKATDWEYVRILQARGRRFACHANQEGTRGAVVSSAQPKQTDA